MSFNRSGFNRAKFNRPSESGVLFSVRMDGQGSMEIDTSVLFKASLELNGEGEASNPFFRLVFADSVFEGDGVISLPLFRLIFPDATFSSEGGWSADSVKFARLYGTWNGQAEQELNMNAVYAGKTSLLGEGSVEIDLSKTTFASMDQWDGETGARIPIGLLKISAFEWAGSGGIRIENESVAIFIMEYDGTLLPDERITINTERFTLKKDGADALPNMVGNFVDLKVGVNEIVIESDTGTRTLIVRVEHRDRWV